MKPAAAPRTPDCKGRAAERRDSGHGRGRLRCCGGTLCARSATMRWRATYPLLPLARSLAVATVASFAHGERSARKR